MSNFRDLGLAHARGPAGADDLDVFASTSVNKDNFSASPGLSSLLQLIQQGQDSHGSLVNLLGALPRGETGAAATVFEALIAAAMPSHAAASPLQQLFDGETDDTLFAVLTKGASGVVAESPGMSDFAAQVLATTTTPVVKAVGTTTPVQTQKSYIVASAVPTDALFGQQWNLLNSGQNGGVKGADLNVLPVWSQYGYSGKGVSIGVFDTSMDVTNKDLAQNVDMSKAVKTAVGFVDPTKIYNANIDTHATAVAGIIAGAKNGSGVVGIAYDAKVTPVDVIDGNGTTYYLQACWQMNKFDITNNSWGWTSNWVMNQLDYSSQYWLLNGLKTAADTGRGGLGTLINFAAGNSHGVMSTETQGQLVDRHVIAVAAATNTGSVAGYSTPGASILVAAPSGGGTLNLISDNWKNTYQQFSGTSGATPEVSGVEALMLNANAGLGWRDVQSILALTARHIGSLVNGSKTGVETDSWTFNHAATWNGGGYHFSNDYGFGLVDAFAAVNVARTWNVAMGAAHTSANELLAQSSVSGNWDIGHAKTNTLSFNITAHQTVEEMVIDLTNLKIDRANDLTITLVSPTGTSSQILIAGQISSSAITNGWEFMSREFRGEDAYGKWTLTISDNKSSDIGSLSAATLKAYGSNAADGSVFFYTDEYSSYGAADASRKTLNYTSGYATIDAAAITGTTAIDLTTRKGSLDGVALNIGASTNVKTVIGGQGGGTITGNNLGDTLYGGLGVDIIKGGLGQDTIDGGRGVDTLTGGGGNDRFIVHQGGYDTITDFLAGDKIMLSRAEFAGFASKGIDSTTFIYGTTKSHVSNAGGGFVFDVSTSSLYYDNSSHGALELIAKLSNKYKLAAGDFLLAS